MFGQGKRTTFTHDEVIQYADFDQGQDLLQSGGQDAIRLLGSGTEEGVVMHKNGGGGVITRALNHLAGVNTGAINAAVKEDFERQHPVLGIEKYHTEDFMLLFARCEFFGMKPRRQATSG